MSAIVAGVVIVAAVKHTLRLLRQPGISYASLLRTVIVDTRERNVQNHHGMHNHDPPPHPSRARLPLQKPQQPHFPVISLLEKKNVLRTVVGVLFGDDVRRPTTEPFKSYRSCNRFSVENTFEDTT